MRAAAPAATPLPAPQQKTSLEGGSSPSVRCSRMRCLCSLQSDGRRDRRRYHHRAAGLTDANRLEPGEGGPSVVFAYFLSCRGRVRTNGFEPAGEAGSSIPWLPEAEEVLDAELFSSLSSRIRLLDDLFLGHPPRGGSHTCSSGSNRGVRRGRQKSESTSDAGPERPANAIGKTGKASEGYGASFLACKLRLLLE